jgi:hypothetical protein
MCEDSSSHIDGSILKQCQTGRRQRNKSHAAVDGTSALYSRGPGFESWPEINHARGALIPGARSPVAQTFYTVAPNICGSSVGCSFQPSGI